MSSKYFWHQLLSWIDNNNIQIIIIDMNSFQLSKNDKAIILEIKNKYFDEIISIFDYQKNEYFSEHFYKNDDSLESLQNKIEEILCPTL